MSSISASLYTNDIDKNNYILDPLIFSYQTQKINVGGDDFRLDKDAVLDVPYSIDVSEENVVNEDSKPQEKIRYYVVQKGDTVEKIARKFGLKKNTIIWVNNLNSKGFLRLNQKLVILPVDGVSYEVQKGDTLSKIAKKFGLKDAKKITKYNKIFGSLKVGQNLIIPNGVLKTEKTRIRKRNKVSKISVRKKVSQASKWIWIKTTDGRRIKHKAWVPTKRIRYTKRDYGYFTHPLPGSIRTQGLHGRNAIDMSAPINTPILAAHSGTVKRAFKSGYNGGFGHYVLIDHGGGIETLYAHMNKVVVYKGQKVVKGQVIGYEGSTGRSTGPHLHFEVHGRKNPF